MDGEIEKMVKTSIELKILEAFKETPDLVDDLVKSALGMEVNDFGGKPNGYHEAKMPFLSWLVQDSIQKIASQAVRDQCETLEPLIKNQVQQKIATSDFADALTDAITKNIKNGYNINIAFTPQEN